MSLTFRSFSIFLTLAVGLMAPFAFAGTSEEGLKWLASKKAEPGVVARPSGLLYKEVRPGVGKTPTVDSPCDCHYSGKLIDGTEFDSSYKRGAPLTFAPNQVIKGWTEAMQLMKEGGKWELYIPSELAYGDSGAGSLIPGGAVLVFELELLKVKGDYVKGQ
jgi:FKBP-type peptidyl-prolyl cis-trans isomerase FklB